ncbi:MAG: tRNA lysidine(34) synthetase TilS [Brevinema sp.]
MISKAIQQFLSQHPNQKILVAVSGGADSLTLLHALSQYTKNLLALHVNHRTRPECADEEDFVQRFCERIGVPILVKSPTKPLSLSMPNFEQEARDARYGIFLETALSESCDLVVTAHHRDDSYETIFLKLFRGATNFFIPQERFLDRSHQVKLIRPFLSIYKEEIQNYISQNNLDYIEDTSNFNTKYLRNFIRHDVLPLIENKIPKLKKHLDHVISERYHQEMFISRLVDQRIADLFPDHTANIEEFLREDPYLQEKILQRKCLDFFGRVITSKQTKEFLRILADRSNGLSTLLQDSSGRLIKEYTRISFYPLEIISKKTSENLEKNPIFVHNNIHSPVNEWNVVVRDRGLAFQAEDVIFSRNFHEKDRIPWGDGSKKVLQFLQDKKISRADYPFVQVIVKNDELVGILGSDFIFILKQHQSSRGGLFFEK